LDKNCLIPLDEYHDQKINKDGNKEPYFYRIDEKTKKKIGIKDLKYQPCVKKFNPEDIGGDDGDDDNDNDKKKVEKTRSISSCQS